MFSLIKNILDERPVICRLLTNRTYNSEHHGTYSEVMKVTNRTYNSEHNGTFSEVMNIMMILIMP